MATDSINTLNYTFVRRPAPKSGPSSSDAWNDSFTELANDLATTSFEWNNKLVPVFDGLPDGTLDTSVNVFRTGLDGQTIWVDQNVVSTDDDLTYFDQVRNRPTTIYESFQDVYTHVAAQIDQVRDDIVDQATGLTTDQKNRIGANVFDNTQTSTSLSLDGKSENNRLNVIQLAADLYGPGYALGNDGATDLANSVFAMVDALLELHNGDWASDITLNHTGVFTATQADINTSAPGNDSYAGSPSDLEDDLNQIRTAIKNVKGTGSWLSALSSLYGGGPDSLQGLLGSTSGSGTQTATNPWGYDYTDVDGLSTRLDAIRDFTGQTTHTDASPTYSSSIYVSSGDSLETAIGDLDTAVNSAETTISGLFDSLAAEIAATRTFVGQDSTLDVVPTYSSTVHINDGDSLEEAIGTLDLVAATQSGIDVAVQANIVSLQSDVSDLQTDLSTHLAQTAPRADLFVMPGSGVATPMTAYPTFTTLSGLYSSEFLDDFVHIDTEPELEYQGPPSGVCKFELNLTGDATVTNDYYFRLAVNGTSVPSTEVGRRIAAANGLGSIGTTKRLLLQPGDKVTVQGANVSGTGNLIANVLQLIVSTS